MKYTLSSNPDDGQACSVVIAGVGLLFFLYFSALLFTRGIEGTASHLMPVLPGLLLFAVGACLD